MVATLALWAVVSTGFLLMQPRFDAGNWEAFLFPVVVAFLGVWLGTSLAIGLPFKLLFLAGFLTLLGYLHLLQIEYLYLEKSDFFDSRNWTVYKQAFIFTNCVAFVIAALGMIGWRMLSQAR